MSREIEQAVDRLVEQEELACPKCGGTTIDHVGGRRKMCRDCTFCAQVEAFQEAAARYRDEEQVEQKKILEQDFSRIDFGSEAEIDPLDIYWAKEFMSDWEKGGIYARGQWYAFNNSIVNALNGWSQEMETPLTRGFLLAVKMLLQGDLSAQASIDYLLNQL